MSGLEASEPARKRLYGKKVTQGEFAKAVSELVKGDAAHNRPKMTQSEICVKLGFKDRKSVRNYVKLGMELGYYSEKKSTSKDDQAYRILANTDAFCQDELIQKWVKNMQIRSRGGRPFGGLSRYVSVFKSVCDTLQTHPAQWVTGANTDEVLEHAREMLTEFCKLYYAGEAKLIYKGDPSKADKIQTPYRFAQVIRDFMKISHFYYPPGDSSIMSQSVAPFHGKYADVRMSVDQYKQGKEYFKKKFGLDSDIFRWFGVGIEALPREGGIFTMKSAYEEFTAKSGKYLKMEAYESKTLQYKGGIWTKYIYSEDVKEAVRIIAKRSPYVIEERDHAKIQDKVLPELRKFYREIGLANKHFKNQDDPSTAYALKKPNHTLRHCGAQLWLERVNWNTSFVARMGWKTAQELTNSYGEMPAAMAFDLL